MILPNGATDVTTYFVLRDSTTHVPKTDVSVTDIDLYYLEQGAAMAAKVDVPEALAAADSAHADNKAFHCGQGLYRVDWPDEAFNGGIGKRAYLIVVCTGVDTEIHEVILSPPADAVAVSGDAAAADILELFAESLKSDTGQLDSGTLADDTITAASINTGALTADAFAADAIVAATLATGAITADAFAADAIVAATLATGALTADAFAANAITNAAVADDVDVNVKTITAGAITAAAIADAAIDNATFAPDVGSTAYATNIIALAVRKVLDELNLDHLLKIADADDVVTDSVIGKMAATDGDWSNFVKTTDSLQSVRDKLPANLEDLNITDTSGLVRPDMANASGNYAGTVAVVTTLTGHTPQTGDAYLVASSISSTLTSVGAAVVAIGLTQSKMAPLLVGTVTGAGTGTEVYTYGGATATVTVDVDGNVSSVVFS